MLQQTQHPEEVLDPKSFTDPRSPRTACHDPHHGTEVTTYLSLALPALRHRRPASWPAYDELRSSPGTRKAGHSPHTVAKPMSTSCCRAYGSQ